MHTIHQLLTFDVCGLVNPVGFVLAVRGRVLYNQPMPIPTSTSSCQLPFGPSVPCRPMSSAAWFISTCDKVGVESIFIPLTTQLKFQLNSDQTMLCPVDFDSQQPPADQLLKVTLHRLFTFWFAINHNKVCTTD